MKTKLLKKIRKEYIINYREKPYSTVKDIVECTDRYGAETISIELKYKLIKPNYDLFQGRYDYLDYESEHETLNDAIECIIKDLRCKYPKLGAVNRKRIKLRKETKVWYNK